MKYLVQNKKEFAITVTAFIMAVINLIRAIKNHEFNEDIVITVILTAVGVLAWYYNMPTSEENCRATGMMRLLKEQRSGKITGENFLDEPEEETQGGDD